VSAPSARLMADSDRRVQQLEARLRKLEGQQDPLSSPEVSTLPGNAGHSPAAQTASPEVVSTRYVWVPPFLMLGP
jgi:hypothetical protein